MIPIVHDVMEIHCHNHVTRPDTCDIVRMCVCVCWGCGRVGGTQSAKVNFLLLDPTLLDNVPL